MNVIFDYLDEFERRAKVLSKKYRSFEDDYNAFLDYLEENPFSGTALGHSMYKHRMPITSKGKGKSGGARVITYNVKQTDESIVITLMTIYDKSEISNVSDTYLKSLVKEVTE
ncbi:MAG: addiction module toxin RelE [Bacteroidales bacterium]|nr:addiction module toxin RelE [Bacteroidales bacterium]